jgi:hypothetical protein
MKAGYAILLTTVYFITFYILLNSNTPLLLTAVAYFSMPLVIIAMVYFVLTDYSVKPKELGDEEWGYGDKNKEDLWIV